jgi:hypothetical protein
MFYRALILRNFDLFNDIYTNYKADFPKGNPELFVELLFDIGQIVYDMYLNQGNRFSNRKQLYKWLEDTLKR